MSDIAQLVREKALAAHQATVQMGVLRTAQKNQALLAMADALLEHSEEILGANQLDMDRAKASGMRESMQDRLRALKAWLTVCVKWQLSKTPSVK